MGFAPPPDAPSVEEQESASVDAGFEAGPPAASLCGFTIPTIRFKLGFKLPAIKFPPDIPLPFLSLSLNCDLDNPVGVSAGVKYGGGRVPTADPDPDLEEAA